MLSSPNHILIYAKAPIVGKCKSRLAAEIGSEAATQLYQKMLRHTLLESQKADAQVRLRVSPDEELQNSENWAEGIEIRQAQGMGDLGFRLNQGFLESFRESAQKVLVIGTDCPGLRHEHLREALQELDNREVVLGPARDGGYYLLGLRQTMPNILQNISWSTDQVLKQTLTILKSAGKSYYLLPELSDVDTKDDLSQYMATGFFQNIGIW